MDFIGYTKKRHFSLQPLLHQCLNNLLWYDNYGVWENFNFPSTTQAPLDHLKPILIVATANQATRTISEGLGKKLPKFFFFLNSMQIARKSGSNGQKIS